MAAGMPARFVSWNWIAAWKSTLTVLGSASGSGRWSRHRHPCLLLPECETILKCNQDSLPVEPADPPKPPLNHLNIRGSEYFDSGEPPTLQ